jgi:hypothetical protein
MGAKLAAYFNQAATIGDFQAKMKLALLTKTTSAKAMEVEDSADNIAIFEAAMKTIKAEFGS